MHSHPVPARFLQPGRLAFLDLLPELQLLPYNFLCVPPHRNKENNQAAVVFGHGRATLRGHGKENGECCIIFVSVGILLRLHPLHRVELPHDSLGCIRLRARPVVHGHHLPPDLHAAVLGQKNRDLCLDTHFRRHHDSYYSFVRHHHGHPNVHQRRIEGQT